jgi:DNA repair exonuclease SbcCD ATPase subunit
MSLQEIRQRLAYIDGRRDSLIDLCTRTELKLEHLSGAADDLDRILAVLRGLEVDYRERLQRRLSKVVSQAVSAVFDEDIKVLIENNTFRGVTSMAIMIEQDGLKTDIFSAKGGTLVDIVAFALRVLMVIWSGLHRVVVLDEPFAHVNGEEYRLRAADLLRELHRQLGVQFIVVAHELEMIDVADVAYEITKAPGLPSKATLIKAQDDQHEAL